MFWCACDSVALVWQQCGRVFLCVIFADMCSAVVEVMALLVSSVGGFSSLSLTFVWGFATRNWRAAAIEAAAVADQGRTLDSITLILL